MMKNYAVRTARLLFGLALFGFGCYLSIQANIGLAPWDAFSMGFAKLTGQSYGNMTVLTGLGILVMDCLLGEKIGVATVLNTLLVGKFVDLFDALGLVPKLDNFFAGVALLLAGQVVLCLGSYFYIGAAMGCGPRDSLMVGVGKKLSRLPIGLVRGGVEAAALLVGWLMGAKVGLGTVIAVFGIGFLLETTFRLLHFDVKAVVHENLFETARRLAGKENKNDLEKKEL